jgi:hypothetical protein
VAAVAAVQTKVLPLALAVMVVVVRGSLALAELLGDLALLALVVVAVVVLTTWEQL